MAMALSIKFKRSRILRYRLALLRSIVTESFRDFFREAWPVIEPTRAQLPSVAVDAVCAALQAVAEGRIRRLGISMPPGTGKSKIVAVAFPAWLLLRTLGRARVMVGSYSFDFAKRDSQFCRDLVQSDWYQTLVDGQWQIRDDANSKDDWWTSASGRRLVTSVEGKSTGERCTMQIIDDALNAKDIFSSPAKLEAIRWIDQVLPSRLEDQRSDQRIIVGQRLGVDDPISAVLKKGWKYLDLSAVLGPCPDLDVGDDLTGGVLTDDAGVEVWRDPRKPGEPIVDLLDVPSLQRLRVDLGASAFSAQYLQRPADDSAAIIRRTWWRFYCPTEQTRSDAARPAGCDEETAAVDKPERFDRVTIAVDLTFGSVTGDYAVVSAWGARGTDRFLLAHWRKRAGFEESLAAIEQMARDFPTAKVLIEKAANGAAAIETLRKRIPGVVAQKPIGKKLQRLGAIAPTVEAGHCYLPLGMPGLADFVEELAGATKHDDQADVAAYAILDLNARPHEIVHGGFAG